MIVTITLMGMGLGIMFLLGLITDSLSTMGGLLDVSGFDEFVLTR